MLDIYVGLFELVEVNKISGDAVEEEGDIWGDTRRVWKLVAQTDTGQRLEFEVVADALRAVIAAGAMRGSGAAKNKWAGRCYLTSLARSTLIKVIYRMSPSGDLALIDWWQANDEDTATWGTGMKPKQIKW